jgi:hypothetical protein
MFRLPMRAAGNSFWRHHVLRLTHFPAACEGRAIRLPGSANRKLPRNETPEPLPPCFLPLVASSHADMEARCVNVNETGLFYHSIRALSSVFSAFLLALPDEVFWPEMRSWGRLSS